MTPLLTLRGLSKQFENGTVALEDVNLSLDKGGITTLLGASGCGKSTLLRIIAGLLEAERGEITWEEPPERGDVGFVFQEPTLPPWAKVRDCIALPFTLMTGRNERTEGRVQEVIDLVGLTDFADAYPRELSGGMKMRVSLARALAPKPRILLMDEPFAALDEITRAKLNTDLIEVSTREEVTVLFVTHSVQEAVFLSEKIFVMRPRPGRVFDDFNIVHMSERDDDYRLSPAFNDKVRDLSHSLRASMETEEATS